MNQWLVNRRNGPWCGVEVKDKPKLASPKTQTSRPPLYKVILLNDDYTPMEFVIDVLKALFHKSHEDAVGITLEVHEKGSGVCGIYPRDVAETKADEVIAWARRNTHPLQCTVERE